MSVRERRGMFSGVAILSCAMIILHISLARLYSAVFGPHVALFAISFSALGAGLGGVLLFVIPRLASPPHLFAQLAYLSCGASGTTVLALIAILRKKPSQDLDTAALTHIGLLYLASLLPSILTGITIAAAVRHGTREISRLHLSDLTGAAAGALGAALALRAGAPRAILIASILAASAAAMFFLASHRPAGAHIDDGRHRTGGIVATFVLGTGVLLAGDIGSPWLKLPAVAWAAIDRVEFQTWNEMSLVTVDKPTAGTAILRSDGIAGGSILDAKIQPPPRPDDMGYALHRGHGSVLVLDAGGGREIRAALRAGQKQILATEENPAIAFDVMRERYKKYSGALYDRSEVNITVESARSYVRRSSAQFRQIIVPLPDTQAATAAGALALSTSQLYTVEAFRELLGRLEPGGTLIVSRFDGEFDRILALAVAALRGEGAASPAEHLFACGQIRTTSLLIKRNPLGKDEIRALRNHCKLRRFVEQFSPDTPVSTARVAAASLAVPRIAPPSSTAQLGPPTDDRPFFFYSIPARRLPEILRDAGTLMGEQWGLLMLVLLLFASTSVVLLLFLAPFLIRRQTAVIVAGGAVCFRALLFFLCIGAGFALAALSVVQHFSVFLGHPARALAVALAALFLLGGIGSVLTAPVAPSDAAAPAGYRAAVLVIALTIYAVALGPVLHATGGLALAARVGLTGLLITPVALLTGSQLPLAVKLVASHKADLLPWCWGIAGAGGAAATASGIVLALYLGFSTVLLAAAAMYLVATIALPPAGDELPPPSRNPSSLADPTAAGAA